MNDSLKDRVSGNIKEKAGDLTGDKHLQTEGKVQDAKGKAEDKAEDVKEHLEGAKDGLFGRETADGDNDSTDR